MWVFPFRKRLQHYKYELGMKAYSISLHYLLPSDAGCERPHSYWETNTELYLQASDFYGKRKSLLDTKERHLTKFVSCNLFWDSPRKTKTIQDGMLYR